MCGIAGYYGTRAIADDRIDACLASMGRRGPDATGMYRFRGPNDRNVLLLHSRLSIVDLDPRANQPFRVGPRALAFNGEIYNYVELRQRFEPPFRTESDTEVLARLLTERGWEGLDGCEGMWAFAQFDERSGELLLSRDRFGEKPLYVFRDASGLYFGSEVKFLAALRGRRFDVDLDHMRRYLVNGYKALYKTPRTFFAGVREVAPGTVISLDAAGGETARRYYHIRRDPIDEQLSFADSVEAVRQALIGSMRLRLRADVPIAFCLSGGVDSNALIAIAKRIFGYDVHGFTILNTDERYEERDMVERSVAELGLRHTAIGIDKSSFLSKLRTLVRQHDAPVYTITYYLQWQLMAAVAARGYRISVSGTGADELFSGYYDHHNAYLAEVSADPSRRASSVAEWRQCVQPYVRNPFLRDPDVFVRDRAERRHIYLNADEFASYLTEPWSEPFLEESYSGSLLRNRMMNELLHEAVPPILHEDDLNAMYYSIENRSPYLDRDLFEVAQRIPTRHLVQRGRAKALLREAARGLAPDIVIDNPRKVGFNAPIFDLLDVRDPDVRAYLLDDGPIYEHVRKDRIAALIERAHLPNSESKFVFYFLNAKMFLEEFAA